MKKDSRLSRALHVILHLAESEVPATSERLAKILQTNPVVVRRLLAGLRDQGIVYSHKGHGGGWQLACDLQTTSLRDIYRAIGSPGCIALDHQEENSTCLVEQAVNVALGDAFDAAEQLLLDRFEQVTLATLSADFNARYALIASKE
ncbi:MAG: Rrf2 family transcriptional regulator [Pseudomonadota bacterium]